MEIQHTHDDRGGKFFIEEPGESETELVYKMRDQHFMVIEHTEVDEKYEGKGIGKQLVAAAIDYARQHDMKVLPMCPFARAVMEKVSEYHDVLAKYS